MKHRQTFAHRLAITVATCAIIYLFFYQVGSVLHPQTQVRPDIAYGYSSVTFSGTVYKDEGTTAVSVGSGVAIDINGVATSTTTTNASGVYTFTGLTISAHDIVTVYINNETADGVLVGKFNDAELSDLSVTGMHIYADRLILRSSASDMNITTTNLKTADNSGDTDITSIYSVQGNDLLMARGKELYIWSSTTHTTSGAVLTHDLEVKGTLTTGTSNIVASGSVVISGTVSTSGDMTLTSVDSGETLQVNGTSLNNLYIDSGMTGYFRMDEGTGEEIESASSSTSVSGTITGPFWTQANTGTTLFFNPAALEFDGVDDYVTFGDAYDIDSTTTKRTFTAWFRRKSSTSEDIIFAKKTGSGTATTGYMLWIDDADDKLRFEVANGSNDYLVLSSTAITDQDWHHVAVSYDPLDTTKINIFLDGVVDVSSKSGSLESGGALSGTFSNATAFQLGDTATSSGPFDGTLDDFRIYARAMTGDELSILGAGYRSTGSGTYTMRSNIDVNGDYCSYAGTLDFGTGYALNVSGDFCNYGGDIRANQGSVVLDGSSQEVRGSAAFYELTKIKTTSVVLTFEANTLQTVSGALTIQGALLNTMDVLSSRTGSQAYLVVEDANDTVLEYLDVRDSSALSGVTLICTEGCIDVGNNTNWEFLSECGDGVVSGSEQCDDGNSVNTDSCPNDCRLAVCGDDVIEGEEQCEPPNSGTCLSNCLLRSSGGGGGAIGTTQDETTYSTRPEPPEGCGNAVLDLDKNEECDEGERFNGIGTCSYDCKKLICGDGIISPQIGEDCEPIIKEQTDEKTIYEVATCGEVCSAPEVTPQGTIVGGCKRLFLQECSAQTSPTESSSSVSNAHCGNGIVDPGEECDFGGVCSGGSFDGTLWMDAATVKTCTDAGGTPMPSAGDGCSDTCVTEFCGDGFIQERGADNQPNTEDDEQCDNGSICSNNPEKSCRLNSDCGEGAECVFNTAANSDCSVTCTLQQSISQELINIAVKPIEDIPEITPEKIAEPFCGDGTIQIHEECDNGDANSDILTNSCRTNCTLPRCGDYVVDQSEQCDNGIGNSDLFPDTCRSDCKLPYCGDGVVDSNEECDGSLICTPQCHLLPPSRQPRLITTPMHTTPPAPPEPVPEILTKMSAPPALVLDADIVIVNPTEYANALKFMTTVDPCSLLVIKGADQKAASIREAAKRQGIPIVENVPLAQHLYATFLPGQKIQGESCGEINPLKPTDIRPIEITIPPPPPEEPLPVEPTLYANGFYPYA